MVSCVRVSAPSVPGYYLDVAPKIFSRVPGLISAGVRAQSAATVKQSKAKKSWNSFLVE